MLNYWYMYIKVWNVREWWKWDIKFDKKQFIEALIPTYDMTYSAGQ